MTRCQCALFLWVFFSFPAHSGFVGFGQWIPWEFVSTELGREDYLLDDQRDSLDLVIGEFTPRLENLRLEGHSRVDRLAFLSPVLKGQVLSGFRLSIDALRIDQFVQREFGGNVIRVRIVASCAPIVIEVPSLTSEAHLAFLSQNDFLPQLTGMNLSIPQGGWSVSPIHCEGLSGIGPEIETALTRALRNPQLLSPLLKDWLATALDGWLKSHWPGLANGENWRDLRISQLTEEGFFLSGEIPLLGTEEVDLDPKLLPVSPATTPRLYLSQEGYRALLQDRLRSFLPVQYDLRSNQSFKKLLSSRLMQYFAWPDLRRFPSSAPFVLKNDPSTLRLSLFGKTGSWLASVSEAGSLVTVIGGAPIDYIVYSMSVAVPLSMDLKDGNLLFSTGEASATIAWSFGYLYQMLYRPQNKIPVNIITGALADLASGKSQEIELPRFVIAGRGYAFTRMTFDDKLVTLEWP